MPQWQFISFEDCPTTNIQNYSHSKIVDGGYASTHIQNPPYLLLIYSANPSSESIKQKIFS
jgi:hypothetical protein